ncbi:Disease resistance protein (CC-NBS-LRR class) family [Euphorbia peplus]|nr:Disease resistance protein (CC-NBS-LRR class) family [Euphorbia peplus]
MGNCLSINSSNTQSEDRMIPISEFENNLDGLKLARERLNKTKDRLTQKLTDEEGTSMRRVEQVSKWLTRVEKKLKKSDALITGGEHEIRQVNRAGRQKSNCSTMLNEKIIEMKDKLDLERVERDKLKDLVERVVPEPDYVLLLRHDVQNLRVASNELRGLRDHLMGRLKDDLADGGMKQIDKLGVWFTNVDPLITRVDKLLSDAQVEIDKWSSGGSPDSSFDDQALESGLKQVMSMIEEGEFPVLVEREYVEAENSESAEELRLVEENLRVLRDEREELWELKNDLISRVNSEEKNDRKRLKSVDIWRNLAEYKLVEVDRMLHQPQVEIEKLRGGNDLSDFGEKVSKMLQDVIVLKSKGVFREVTAPQLPEQVVEIEWERAVGLQSKLDDAWSILMEKEVGILGIYGLGGIGKTTLLTHINNKFLYTPSDFDFVIWVLASKDYKLSSVQQQIGERIGISVSGWKEKEDSEKAKEIYSILRKKKFVLLLDDLWEKIDLELVGVPVPKRPNGSKVVITARSELICSQMGARKRIKVDKLPPELAWILFEEEVGKEILCLDPAICPLAKQVVEKCDGLPLAINVIARAMTFSKTAEEWRVTLADLQQSASEVKADLFVRLKISYDKLPEDIFRFCFIFIALFPAESRIYKDDLIDYLISEKLESAEENLTRARARYIIHHLVNVCLLEEEGSRYVKMHNMIRELALWISCDLEKAKYNFLVQPGKQLTEAPEVEKWKGVKRTSLMENSIPNLQLPGLSICPNLSTLLLCHNPLREITSSIAGALTVLDLSSTEVDQLPEDSDLNSLQYLNLSCTKMKQLPKALQNLKKLIYLNLEYNNFSHMISKGFISGFPSLQVLRMFCSGFTFGEELNNVHIKEMQLLKNLNVVSITIGSNDALQIYLSSKNLPNCTRALSLEHLPGSKSIEFSPTENMNQFEKLQIIASEHLEQIHFSPKFSCFASLREVTIENCPCLLNLNWLVQALNLEVLKIKDCKTMREVMKGDSGTNLVTFSKLEVVELEKLPQLDRICSNVLPLPCMKRIKVFDCPTLRKFPLNPEIIKARKIIVEDEQDLLKNVEWMGN